MAYSIIQVAAASDIAESVDSLSTGLFASPVTAHNAILVFFAFNAGSAKTATAARSTDVYSEVGTGLFDGAFGVGLHAYLCTDAHGGTTDVVATLSGAGSELAIAAVEISGIAGSSAIAGSVFTRQDNPGGSIDAVTAGPTGTLLGQPAAAISIDFEMLQVTGASAAGTGFTGLTPIWNYDQPTTPYAIIEHKRVVATTAVTSTFTTPDGGTSHIMATVVLLEGTGGGGGGSDVSKGNNGAMNGGFPDMDGGFSMAARRKFKRSRGGIMVPRSYQHV